MMKNNVIIDKILYNYFTKLPDLDYFIVANTFKAIDCQHKIDNANKDELFSRTEFSEIASAIFDCFGFVNVFYSEQDFIQYALNLKTSESCFIFNFARNGMHEGKKSLIPAFCDLYKLKYSGSNAFVISLLRNKFVYGNFLSKFNIPVPPSCLYERGEYYLGDYNKLITKKIIAKNVYESASIGLTQDNIFVLNKNSEMTLDNVLSNMQSKKILIQQYIYGKECEVLVFQDGLTYHALDPVEIIFNDSEFMDSSTSNSYDYRFDDLSKSISMETINKIQNYAILAAKLLNIKDYARFDFRIDINENVYLIDIAGTPYSIKHSSIAHLFTKMYDYKYSDIYKCIAALSYNNYLTK